MTLAVDTREQILETARDLLQRLTYHAFSYSDISAEVGIRKASIHYHFPTKEDLGVAIVDVYLDEFFTWRANLEANRISPLAKLQAYFEMFGCIATDKICPLGTLSASVAGLPERLQEKLRELIYTHRAWLRETLKLGQECGEIISDQPHVELSALVGSSLLGALQIARATGTREIYDAVVNQLNRTLKA
ncbi:MAG: TetR/AcrR family transcriptional regulator [Acidobacteria bacterium]|nr:TetR/AcrR family transcriptional regulator [Acidobacteriota bacterium]